MSMPDHQKHLLNKHRVFLVRELILDEEFFSVLMSDHTLTSSMCDDIKSAKTAHSRAGKLLDILPKRGANAFGKFIEALYETSQDHIARVLGSSGASSSSPASQMISQPVDDRRFDRFSPSDTSSGNVIHKPKHPEAKSQQPSGNEERKPVQEINPNDSTCGKQPVQDITPNDPGSCGKRLKEVIEEIIQLIENANNRNINFIDSDSSLNCIGGTEPGRTESLKNGRGAIFRTGPPPDFDDINLDVAFKKFGFEIKSAVNNKDSEGIIESLREEVKKETLAFFLFVFAKNEDHLSVQRISEIFKDSAILKGKPKVLIFETVNCSGDQTDSVSEPAVANFSQKFNQLTLNSSDLNDCNMAVLTVESQARSRISWIVWSFAILLKRYSKTYDLATMLQITEGILNARNSVAVLKSSLKEGLYFNATD